LRTGRGAISRIVRKTRTKTPKSEGGSQNDRVTYLFSSFAQTSLTEETADGLSDGMSISINDTETGRGEFAEQTENRAHQCFLFKLAQQVTVSLLQSADWRSKDFDAESLKTPICPTRYRRFNAL